MRFADNDSNSPMTIPAELTNDEILETLAVRLERDMGYAVRQAMDRYRTSMAEASRRLSLTRQCYEQDLVRPSKWYDSNPKQTLLGSMSYWGEDVHCDPEDLPTVHAIFGQCKAKGGDDVFDVFDAERGLIKVPLDVGDNPTHFRFWLIKELPADAKCKIVTTVETVRNSYVSCETR